MNISTTVVDGVTVATLEGSLDTNTSTFAERSLSSIVDEGAKRLLLNFENVDFVASTGLRILLVISKRLASENGALAVCALNETVNEVFEISGFNVILKVFKTQEDGLRSFDGS